MWTEAQLVEDLRELGLPSDAKVLVHTSLRSIGPMESGPETLARAFVTHLGNDGTLMVPTFTFSHGDPAEWRNPPSSDLELERFRCLIPIFDADTTPADTTSVGYFPELVRRLPGAQRSNHPVVPFAAVGPNAEYLTKNSPFHYPLGSESPVAKLHQLDGWVLLIGVGHTVNTSIHLAEVWADVPYVHRSATIKTAPGHWSVMRGSPECSDGFGRIERVLRQARILREGYIGNAKCQLIRQRELVSMAVAMLQGDHAALLCGEPHCPWCTVARKLTAEQQRLT